MTKTRKAHVKALVCHPKILRSKDCLSTPNLSRLARAYGVPFHTMKASSIRKLITRKARCKSERCWIDRAPMDQKEKDHLVKAFFRPTMPDSWRSDPDEWLDSTNIDAVMKQYEEAYPEFKFYGTNPIDFAAPDPYDKAAAAAKKCLNESICRLNLSEMTRQGKTKLGFVYNLDPSNMGGSHWIASFTDIPAHKTYYFDSYGIEPPNQIARFMKALVLQDPKMTLQYNAKQFQYGGSECGMYSLYFLIRMIEGESFRRFCRKPIRDEEMLKLRQGIFSPKDI